MSHLKHSGPIRQAAHAKRTALVEILSDKHAANDEPSSDQVTSAYLARSLNEAYGDPILDESFFARADASQPSAEQREAATVRAGMLLEIDRPSELQLAMWGRS